MVLGCRYNVSQARCMSGEGFNGYLTQVSLYNRELLFKVYMYLYFMLSIWCYVNCVVIFSLGDNWYLKEGVMKITGNSSSRYIAITFL
jgi:hypothetical protein